MLQPRRSPHYPTGTEVNSRRSNFSNPIRPAVAPLPAGLLAALSRSWRGPKKGRRCCHRNASRAYRLSPYVQS